MAKRLPFPKRLDARRDSVAHAQRYSTSPLSRDWVKMFDQVSSLVHHSRDLISVAIDEGRPKQHRTFAIWVLGKLGVRVAVRPLLKLLQQPDPEVSFRASEAL